MVIEFKCPLCKKNITEEINPPVISSKFIYLDNGIQQKIKHDKSTQTLFPITSTSSQSIASFNTPFSATNTTSIQSKVNLLSNVAATSFSPSL